MKFEYILRYGKYRCQCTWGFRWVDLIPVLRCTEIECYSVLYSPMLPQNPDLNLDPLMSDSLSIGENQKRKA